MRASSLSDRMKEYELVSQTKLIKKLPVIIRLDGRGFSKFTRGFEKPVDKELSTIFQTKMTQNGMKCLLKDNVILYNLEILLS